jgi:nucleoside-diphosphate-sugar epimerase
MPHASQENALTNVSLAGARVLVTGAAGFIGAALCRSLQDRGALVVGLDLEAGRQGSQGDAPPPCSELYRGDMSDPVLLEKALPGCAVVFNLAGKCGHLASMEEPLADMHSNGVAQLALLEGCRRWAGNAHVIFASTRQVYGRVPVLPVSEAQPLSPVDVNGIHKMAAELLHLLYSRQYGLCATVLRLTNTYGAGMNIHGPGRSFLGEWLRMLLQAEPLVLLGSGEQLRDLNAVEDVVDAFVRTAEAGRTVDREVFNLGGRTPVSLSELAKELFELTGGGVRWRLEPFPAELRSIDIGDYWGDYTKIHSTLGWEPKTPLREGLARLLESTRITSIQPVSPPRLQPSL